MGFKAALEATKVAKTSVKKVTVPVLSDVPQDVVDAAKAFLEKTRMKKELEAELALYGETVSSYVSSVQDSKAFNGEFFNSYKIPTQVGELTATTKNVFKINTEDEKLLKKLFGNRYETYIAEKMEVVLKPEVLEDEKLQDELIEALGEDGFAKFFNTFTSLKVKDNYDERIYEFAKNADKLAEIRAIVQPSKTTLK